MRILIALLLALVPSLAQAQPPAATHPVYVMRHLNTPAGQPDPDLLPEGRATAIALADLMETDQFEGRRPVAIYVSDYKRTRQTAAPTAARLALNLTVYDPRDTAGLISRIRAEPGPVLVIGHSNTVPDIVAALGGERPAALVHEDFGDLWIVQPGGATTKQRIGAR